MSTKKFNDSGEIYRFKVIHFDEGGRKSMTLAELSMEYEASAGLIYGRLTELRLALRQEVDTEAAGRLRRRIEALRPMLTQCRKLSHLTAHYYDPDFWHYDEYSL